MGGVILASAAGLVGAVVPSDASVIAAVMLAVYSLVWHLRGMQRFRGSRSGWQADRRLAMQTRLGRVYFGALLGLGVVTFMTTPLVYTLALYAAAVHLPTGLLAGVGFGLGRSRPLITGLRAHGRLTPAAVADRFSRLSIADRVLGCLLASAIIATTLTPVA